MSAYPVKFGKYVLLERVNVGGMAEVFKAKASKGDNDTLVALKRILPNLVEDEEFVRMFIDEARIAVQLNHPNIIKIYELGQHGEHYYISMEYVPSRDLRALLDRMRGNGQLMSIAEAALVTSRVCEGLDYAHRRRDAQGTPMNIIHRDVSPQNVLIGFDGEIKIIDFGIAKAANRASKTQAGVLKGKFGYMSPEQVRGLPTDRRSDVFAVGVLLYEMLTGERLFIGESDFSTLERVRNAEVPPPSQFNKKIPQALEGVVLRALARDVGDRFQWASELASALAPYIDDGGRGAQRRLVTLMREQYAAEIAVEQKRNDEFKRVSAADARVERGSHNAKSSVLPLPNAGPDEDSDDRTFVIEAADDARRPAPAPRPVFVADDAETIAPSQVRQFLEHLQRPASVLSETATRPPRVATAERDDDVSLYGNGEKPYEDDSRTQVSVANPFLPPGDNTSDADDEIDASEADGGAADGMTAALNIRGPTPQMALDRPDFDLGGDAPTMALAAVSPEPPRAEEMFSPREGTLTAPPDLPASVDSLPPHRFDADALATMGPGGPAFDDVDASNSTVALDAKASKRLLAEARVVPRHSAAERSAASLKVRPQAQLPMPAVIALTVALVVLCGSVAFTVSRWVAPATPSVTLVPVGRDSVAARVLLDGQPVGALLPVSFAVVPGVHQLRVEVEGMAPIERPLRLAASSRQLVYLEPEVRAQAELPPGDDEVPQPPTPPPADPTPVAVKSPKAPPAGEKSNPGVHKPDAPKVGPRIEKAPEHTAEKAEKPDKQPRATDTKKAVTLQVGSRPTLQVFLDGKAKGARIFYGPDALTTTVGTHTLEFVDNAKKRKIRVRVTVTAPNTSNKVLLDAAQASPVLKFEGSVTAKLID